MPEGSGRAGASPWPTGHTVIELGAPGWVNKALRSQHGLARWSAIALLADLSRTQSRLACVARRIAHGARALWLTRPPDMPHPY